MNMYWKLFIDAKSLKNTEVVFNRVINILSVKFTNLTIEPYHKGGFTCSFLTSNNSDQWSETVINSLSLAQKIGRDWILLENIRIELNAWSNKPSIPGVQNIQLIVESNT